MIRVLVADDSAFMRRIISDLFNGASDFETVGTARNGQETIEKVKSLKPDLLMLDINMPVMDGLTALEIIMRDHPLPVVMFSSLTQYGADATIKALSLGAVDFIKKSGGAVSRIDGQEQTILNKCRAAVGAKLRKGFTSRQFADKMILPAERSNLISVASTSAAVGGRSFFGGGSASDKLIAIGTSTGGPRALQSVIPLLPKDLPCGVVIVQHMPAGFTKSLADRLDSISEISVKEAEDGDVIRPAQAFIAPGNYHMVVEARGKEKIVRLNQNPRVGNLRPAADVLFQSLAVFGKNIVAVILTGMGSDGSKGLKYIKDAGGYAIGESETTAVVYGMPKAAAELGLIDKVLPIDKVAAEIVQQVRK